MTTSFLLYLLCLFPFLLSLPLSSFLPCLFSAVFVLCEIVVIWRPPRSEKLSVGESFKLIIIIIIKWLWEKLDNVEDLITIGTRQDNCDDLKPIRELVKSAAGTSVLGSIGTLIKCTRLRSNLCR